MTGFGVLEGEQLVLYTCHPRAPEIVFPILVLDESECESLMYILKKGVEGMMQSNEIYREIGER